MKTYRQSTRTWIIGAIIALMIVLIVTPAFATYVTVTGDYVCDEATGDYIVTWHASNSQSEAEQTMTISAVSRPLEGMAAGDTVEPSGSISGTEVVPADFSGSITLTVDVYWDYATPSITSTDEFTLELTAPCTAPGTAVTPVNTVTTPVSTLAPVGTVTPATGTPTTPVGTVTVPAGTTTPPAVTDTPDPLTPTLEVTPSATPLEGTNAGLGTSPVAPDDTSLIVEGACGSPVTFTITNTGPSMTEPHGYYILSSLNQTVLATGGFQLEAGETAQAILPDNIDASDGVIFVTNDFDLYAEAALYCGEAAPSTGTDPFTGLTSSMTGISASAACESGCPEFKIYHTDEVGGWEIFRLDSADEQTRTTVRSNLSLGLDPLVKSTAPSLSPDNNWVIFSSNRDGNWELYVAPVSGENADAVERVTYNTIAIDSDPVWGPNNLVVYETTRNGSWDLYALDMETGMNYRLTDSAGNDINADWSVDGTRVLFQSDRPDADGVRSWQVYELNLATLALTDLSDGTTVDVNPQYSNSGERILFRSYENAGSNGVIEVMNADGSERMAISDAVGDTANAVWSPNDTFIAYQSDLDGDLDIYVYEVGTGRTRHLTDNSVADYAPTWLCDDNTVVWTSEITGDANVFEVSVTPITAGPIPVNPDADQLTFEISSDIYPMSLPQDESASREGGTVLGDFGQQTVFLEPEVDLTAIDLSFDGAMRPKWQPINACTLGLISVGD